MKTLKERRGYALGERNPATLPDALSGDGGTRGAAHAGTKDKESEAKNAERTAHWAEVRKLALADRLPRKYYH